MKETIENFYSKAIKVFRRVGGTEEEFMWLVGSKIALYPLHKNEIRLRLKAMNEIAKRADGKILEIGSGSGLLALKLSERGFVIGVEKTEDFFPFLKELENDRLKFIKADFLRDNIGYNFNTIVFSYILHDLNPIPFLKKAVQVLGTRGKIIISDFDIDQLRDRVMEITSPYGLKVCENFVLGRAFTHGKEHDCFLLLLKKIPPR